MPVSATVAVTEGIRRAVDVDLHAPRRGIDVDPQVVPFLAVGEELREFRADRERWNWNSPSSPPAVPVIVVVVVAARRRFPESPDLTDDQAFAVAVHADGAVVFRILVIEDDLGGDLRVGAVDTDVRLDASSGERIQAGNAFDERQVVPAPEGGEHSLGAPEGASHGDPVGIARRGGIGKGVAEEQRARLRGAGEVAGEGGGGGGGGTTKAMITCRSRRWRHCRPSPWPTR